MHSLEADCVGSGVQFERGVSMSRFRFAAALVSSFLVLIGVAAAAVAPSGPPTSTGTGGAAASVETLATQAAINSLKRGGNAVDAAVTAAGVLGVAEPFSCGIGGGGFMVIHRASDGKVTTIDGRETAPAAMTPTSFMWDNGKAPAFTTARYSGMSVGVPGTPATWGEALEKYGTFSLTQALAPGIALARNGVRRRPSVPRSDRGEPAGLSRRAVVGGPLPQARRHGARR